MAKLKKDKIRAARGFKKQADMCKNCNNFCAENSKDAAHCGLASDLFNVSQASWCHKHDRRED